MKDHPASFPQNIAPNAIRLGLNVLFPWSSAANLRGRESYPGIYRGALFLLGGKARADTLKDWCSGRRKAPPWFVSVLRDELLARREQIDCAIAALDAYEYGRGYGSGLKDWWRNKRNAEIEAARRNAPHSRW